MTTRTKFEVFAVIAACLLFGLVAHSYMQEHDLRLTAEATVSSAQQIINQDSAKIVTLQKADQVRDAATAEQVTAIAAGAAKQVTPKQIADWIPKQLPGPLQNVKITVPAPSPQNPAPDATAEIPVGDLPMLRDQIAACQECAVKLDASQKDIVSRDEQLRLAGEKLSAAEKQRDAYKAAAKGGNFFTRLKNNADMLATGGAIGVGVTMVLVCGSGHCK
jgi:hypothetical protein